MSEPATQSRQAEAVQTTPSAGEPDAMSWYDKLASAGLSKRDILDAEDLAAQRSKKNLVVAALTGGTALGAVFVAASPMRAGNRSWESFSHNAPKLAAAGFAAGAALGGAAALWQNIRVDHDKRVTDRTIDILDQARNATLAESQGRGK